jgi:hypothetical protein
LAFGKGKDCALTFDVCLALLLLSLLLLLLLLKARDLKHRHRGHLMEHMEVVVDVKGPGQVVGEVFMQEAPPPCRYGARARGDVLALKLTQENYVRALAAMMYEAEHGARASAHSAGASRGRPLPSASASSPGMLGMPSAAAVAAAAAAASISPPVHAGRSGPLPGASSRFPAVHPASSFLQQSALPPHSAAAAVAGGVGAGSAAVPMSQQGSVCCSTPSIKDAGAQLSSSTPFDSSMAQLSMLAANNTSSSGSLAMRGGPLKSARGAAGSIVDDSGPLRLIGSEGATDDEGQELHQPMSVPGGGAAGSGAAAPVAAAATASGS